MTTAKPSYGASAALTITLASLAASATAGQESTAIDNTSDLAVDSLVGGIIKTATVSSPVSVEIWATGSYDGTTYGGGAAGSNGGLTPTPKSSLKLIAIIPATASTTSYKWGPFSIAQAFGGTMPKKWGIWILNNTGAALDSTAGNHEVKYTPVQYQSV